MRVLYDPGSVVGAITGKKSKTKTIIREPAPAPAPEQKSEDDAGDQARAEAARESTLRRGRRSALVAGGFGAPSSSLTAQRASLLGGG